MKNNEYIRIGNSEFIYSRVNIKSENDLFLGDLIMNITDSFVSFERPTLDYRGKTHKIHKKSSNTHYIRIFEIEIKF